MTRPGRGVFELVGGEEEAHAVVERTPTLRTAVSHHVEAISAEASRTCLHHGAQVAVAMGPQHAEALTRGAGSISVSRRPAQSGLQGAASEDATSFR